MQDMLEAGSSIQEPLPLDPFGWRPLWASLIPGLGGNEPSPDPSYVFATLDSLPGIGPVCATVHFFDLAVTRGTFLFEVRVRSAVPGAEQARLQTVAVNAQELTATGGTVELRFESYRNAYYSIACSINDDTDVTALHVSVSFDRRATPAQHGREWEWATRAAVHRPTNIERALVRRSLTDLCMPSLAEPVSQIASPSQCQEPTFVEVMRALARDPAATFENWSLAYVLSAIARFSVGKRGRLRGQGSNLATLMSYFAGQQCEVVGLEHIEGADTVIDPGQTLQQSRIAALCDEASFFANAHLVAGDIHRPIDTFRDQFDIIWSIGVNRLMSPKDCVPYIVNDLAHARLGGLAVHVVDYVEDVGVDKGRSLNRHDIERLATLALSHNVDVAQLRFQYGATLPSRGAPLPFGIVLLRGTG